MKRARGRGDTQIEYLLLQALERAGRRRKGRRVPEAGTDEPDEPYGAREAGSAETDSAASAEADGSCSRSGSGGRRGGRRGERRD